MTRRPAALLLAAIVVLAVSGARTSARAEQAPASHVEGHALDSPGGASQPAGSMIRASDAQSASDQQAQQQPLPPGIPAITDADRQAAFPEVHHHPVHGEGMHGYVLFDQFEGRTGSGAQVFSWDTKGWIGGDRNRFWFRTEGDRVGEHWEQAQHNLLFGRAISPWWDLIAGVRIDTLPGTPRTALAVGVQGLAPGRTEVELSAYVEPSGRTHVRVESEYELLITNRLAFQPLVEFEVYGSADPGRQFGRGLTAGEFGVRLRYEFRREFAPYAGVVWSRKFFGTRDLAEDAGARTGSTRFTAGVRFWM